jgi:hypothetical protein
MKKMLQTTKPYSVVILHRTSRRDEPGADKIVWKHGRRNFELRRDGLLCIVGLVNRDESDVAGICIFSTDMKKVRQIMEEDPGVKTGIFTYEVHSMESFPGDALAK